MPTRFERVFLAFARQATRPAVLGLWCVVLVVSTVIAGVTHPPARWWLLASTGATIISFCLYVAFLRRNRQMSAVRSRIDAFERMAADVELHTSRRGRLRQVTLNGELYDDGSRRDRIG
jgi:low affinity Fe/Cu permease